MYSEDSQLWPEQSSQLWPGLPVQPASLGQGASLMSKRKRDTEPGGGDFDAPSYEAGPNFHGSSERCISGDDGAFQTRHTGAEKRDYVPVPPPPPPLKLQPHPINPPAFPPPPAAQATNKRRSNFSEAELSKYYSLPMQEAAAWLGVSPTTLKRISRRKGIEVWPYRRICGLKTREREIRNRLARWKPHVEQRAAEARARSEAANFREMGLDIGPMPAAAAAAAVAAARSKSVNAAKNYQREAELRARLSEELARVTQELDGLCGNGTYNNSAPQRLPAISTVVAAGGASVGQAGGGGGGGSGSASGSSAGMRAAFMGTPVLPPEQAFAAETFMSLWTAPNRMWA